MRVPSMEHPPCGPLTGWTGRVIVLLGGIITVWLYVIKYQRDRLRGVDVRTLTVFVFDLSKILVSGGVAWCILIGGAALLGKQPILIDGGGEAVASALQVQPIAWYLPALVLESTMGAATGIFLGRIVNRICTWYAARHHADHGTTTFAYEFAIRNARYGKYSPQHCAVACPTAMDSGYERINNGGAVNNGGQDTVLWSWWFAQLASWCTCVALSRIMVVVMMEYASRTIPPRINPLIAMAKWIDGIEASCGAKQIVCFGLARLVIDLLLIAVTDAWNRLNPRG